jgi:hypothetical protein
MDSRTVQFDRQGPVQGGLAVNVDELTETVRRMGGVLELDGENVRYRLPKSALHLTSELKERKVEILAFLRGRGGRFAAFPHCPRCASYALFRRDGGSVFECLTCGLLEIEESVARRVA